MKVPNASTPNFSYEHAAPVRKMSSNHSTEPSVIQNAMCDRDFPQLTLDDFHGGRG